MRVDEAELRGRHAELDALQRDAHVACQRELEPAADRVAGERGHRRVGKRLERGDRFRERVRDELLRALFELLVGNLADVIAGREHAVRAGEHQAACRRCRRAQLAQRRGDRVEDRMVERVALRRVGDREASDILGRLVDQQLAVCELAGWSAGGHAPTD